MIPLYKEKLAFCGLFLLSGKHIKNVICVFSLDKTRFIVYNRMYSNGGIVFRRVYESIKS